MLFARISDLGDNQHKKRGQRLHHYALERAARATTNTAVHTDQLYPITRFALVHQVVVQNNVRTPWKLTRWRTFRHLLNTDALVVPESAETEFSL